MNREGTGVGENVGVSALPTTGKNVKSNLEDVAQLGRNSPFLGCELVHVQAVFPGGTETVQGLPIFDGNIEHVKRRVPSSLDIAGDETIRELELLQDAVPGRKYFGRRINDLESQLPDLSTV